MSKTTFFKGQILTPQILTALNNPTPDGQDLDGHGPAVTDAMLTNAAANIKPNFYEIYNELRVSYVSGLNFAYTAGTVLLPGGTTATISAGTIALPNNATNFIYVTSAGAIGVSPSLPLGSYSLAKVTTSGGILSGNIIDQRRTVKPVLQSVTLNTPAFFVFKDNTSQRQTTQTTVVSWNGEKFDSDNAMGTTSFVVPANKAGFYEFGGSVLVKNFSATTKDYRVYLAVNSINQVRLSSIQIATNTAVSMSLSNTLISLNVGDIVQLFVDNFNNGGDYEIGYSLGSLLPEVTTFFHGKKLAY